MKLKITTNQFNDINDIEFKDGYDVTWSEWRSYSPSELEDYTDYTREQLEQSPALCDVLSRAMNRANEQAVANEWDDAFCDAYENFIEKLEEVLNDITHNCESGKIDGKVSLTLTQKPDVVGGYGEIVIEGHANTLALITAEIINGEGYFRYDSLNEFATVMDGKFAPARAVENHLHYLLKYSRIADIWGLRGGDINDMIDDRRISYAYPEDDVINEVIEYELEEAEDDTDVQDELLAIKYATEAVAVPA